MLLAGRNGDQFELNLLGYQFPKIEDDEWDSNWLKIRISATNERGSWTATDSSLVTREVMLLADWLQAIADRNEAGTELEFTERISPSNSLRPNEASGYALVRARIETAVGARRRSPGTRPVRRSRRVERRSPGCV